MFKSGMPVHGDDFIDRKEHLKKFNTFIKNDQHIMIKAPRRYGKTSLILQIFENYKYKKIYIDVKRATSLKSLAEQIINEAYKIAGVNGVISKAKDSISALFKQLRGSLKIDLEIAELTIETLEKNEKNQLSQEEFFFYAVDLVQKIAKKQDINIKFAFDEFQDILTISEKKILDKLRSVIQHHENVTYIFLGSIESIMNSIFSSKTSPFFHFTRVIELDGLETKEVKEYCKNFFSSKGIEYDMFLNEVIEYLNGHPYYTMKTLQSCYFEVLDTNSKKITKQNCMNALTTALFETKPYLEEVIEKIKQKKHHFSVIWHLANNQKNSSIDSTTLYKTYKSLENMGYIKKVGKGEYRINDIFLKILLMQNSDLKLLQNRVEFYGLPQSNGAK